MGQATDVMRRKFAALNAQDGEEMMKHFSPEAQKEIPRAPFFEAASR
jgi:ketosteroid isomerase-like protein